MIQHTCQVWNLKPKRKVISNFRWSYVITVSICNSHYHSWRCDCSLLNWSSIYFFFSKIFIQAFAEKEEEEEEEEKEEVEEWYKMI